MRDRVPVSALVLNLKNRPRLEPDGAPDVRVDSEIGVAHDGLTQLVDAFVETPGLLRGRDAVAEVITMDVAAGHIHAFEIAVALELGEIATAVFERDGGLADRFEVFFLHDNIAGCFAPISEELPIHRALDCMDLRANRSFHARSCSGEG